MIPTKDDDFPGWSTGEISQLGRPGKSAVATPAIPLLQPIERVPKSGKTIMVYCPGETPEHVAAVWASAKNEEGGIAWEGLMFAEPMLADVCPDGPQNATHWYYPPTIDTRIEPHSGGTIDRSTIDPDTFRREYLAAFESTKASEHFTVEQLQVLKERGLRAADVKIFWDEQVELDRISDYTRSSIIDDRPVIRRVTRRPCPVLTDFRPKKNDAYIVWPDGTIGLARWPDK